MTSSSFKIRAMADGEAEEVLDLFRSRPEHFSRGTEGAVRNNMRPHSGFQYLVAHDGAAVAGCVIWSHGLYDASIDWILTAGGKERRGIARALIDHVIGLMRAGGLHHLQVKTAPLVPGEAADPYFAAHALYRACGFLEIATLPKYWPSGEDAILFMKRVG